jgi:hypothetical protein
MEVRVQVAAWRDRCEEVCGEGCKRMQVGRGVDVESSGDDAWRGDRGEMQCG